MNQLTHYEERAQSPAQIKIKIIRYKDFKKNNTHKDMKPLKIDFHIMFINELCKR